MAFFRKKSPAPENDPDALVERGMKQLRSGEAEAAVEAFAAAVKLDPRHGQAWYCKGCAHADLGQHEDAIHAYRESAKHAGDRAALPLFNLGNLYQELEQLQEAARCFHEAAKADPTMADAWINLGRILDDSGQHVPAIECYDKALEHAPDDVMAWSNRGNSLRALERFDEALASYRKALALDGDDLAARVGAGACLVECGQPAEGIAALRKAAEETRQPLVLFELATALAKTEQFEAAVSMYDALIDADFVSAQIWNNRGECLTRLDRVEEAIESFDFALAVDPDFAPACFGKARTLVNAGRIEEARPVVERYLELVDEGDRQAPHVQALVSLCGLEA
jgi:tetratricopeptide (TPR) repeat protein